MIYPPVNDLVKKIGKNGNRYNLVIATAKRTRQIAEAEKSGALAQLKVWLIVPVNDMEVMVLNKIRIYEQDFMMMATSIMLCSLLFGIFVIYRKFIKKK